MADWITIEDAVKLSGYHANYIRILLRTEQIKGQKWMRSWQISRTSLNRFLKTKQKYGQKRGRKPNAAS